MLEATQSVFVHNIPNYSSGQAEVNKVKIREVVKNFISAVSRAIEQGKRTSASSISPHFIEDIVQTTKAAGDNGPRLLTEVLDDLSSQLSPDYLTDELGRLASDYIDRYKPQADNALELLVEFAQIDRISSLRSNAEMQLRKLGAKDSERVMFAIKHYLIDKANDGVTDKTSYNVALTYVLEIIRAIEREKTRTELIGKTRFTG